MQKLVVPNTGEEHGLINEIPNSCTDKGSYHPSIKDKMEKLRKEESKIVKARYLNSRGATQRLKKPYMHWAGDKIQMWNFIPDQVYEVPKGLIDEVNSELFRPKKHAGLMDKFGKVLLTDTKEEPLHRFVPAEF